MVPRRKPSRHASARRQGAAGWHSPRMPGVTSRRLRAPSAHGIMGQAAACPCLVLRACGPDVSSPKLVYKAQGASPGFVENCSAVRTLRHCYGLVSDAEVVAEILFELAGGGKDGFHLAWLLALGAFERTRAGVFLFLESA